MSDCILEPMHRLTYLKLRHSSHAIHRYDYKTRSQEDGLYRQRRHETSEKHDWKWEQRKKEGTGCKAVRLLRLVCGVCDRTSKYGGDVQEREVGRRAGRNIRRCVVSY